MSSGQILQDCTTAESEPWVWMNGEVVVWRTIKSTIQITEEQYRDVFGELFQVQPSRWERFRHWLRL